MTDKGTREGALPSCEGLPHGQIDLANSLGAQGIPWHQCPTCSRIAMGFFGSCDACWEVESRLRNYITQPGGRRHVLETLGEFYDEERRALLADIEGFTGSREQAELISRLETFLMKIGPTLREPLSVTAPTIPSPPPAPPSEEEPCNCMDCQIAGEPTH